MCSWGGERGGSQCLSSPTPSYAAVSSSYKDLISIMTPGNWNGQRKLSGEGKYTLHLEKSGNKINLSVKIS